MDISAAATMRRCFAICIAKYIFSTIKNGIPNLLYPRIDLSNNLFYFIWMIYDVCQNSTLYLWINTSNARLLVEIISVKQMKMIWIIVIHSPSLTHGNVCDVCLYRSRLWHTFEWYYKGGAIFVILKSPNNCILSWAICLLDTMVEIEGLRSYECSEPVATRHTATLMCHMASELGKVMTC